MKREYNISYEKNRQIYYELMNTIETLLFIAIAKFDKKIENIKISEFEL